MLPGLSRMQCAPASIAFSARVWLKWMSAITGIGDSLDDRLQRDRVLVARDRDADQVGPRLGDLVDLLHGRLEVGGLGLGHRLHGDRRAAADRHAADEDLALGCHRGHCDSGGAPTTVERADGPRDPQRPSLRASKHRRAGPITAGAASRSLPPAPRWRLASCSPPARWRLRSTSMSPPRAPSRWATPRSTPRNSRSPGIARSRSSNAAASGGPWSRRPCPALVDARGWGPLNHRRRSP